MGDEHLHGWKSIAAHLRRDRSTVIRWANERNLPVHSVPGGKSRTVYAVKRELDTWLLGHGAAPAPALATPVPVPEPVLPSPVRASEPAPKVGASRRTIMVAALIGVAALAAGAGFRHAVPAANATLDAATTARFLAARDDVASRVPGHLARAIATLRGIVARHPGHANAHGALAEAYMLAREYGSLPDALAFASAQEQARAALAIDPGTAIAHRVEGAIGYWRDGDAVAAGAAFRRAIAAAPGDPLGHLWYANALSDNGETAAAAREFAAARRLDPGSVVVLTDAAWGAWSAGQGEAAIAQWRDLQRQYPSLSSIADCLSVAFLDRGDLAGYAAQLRQRAKGRSEVELLAYSDLIDRALASGGGPAVYDVMLSRALAFANGTEQPDHSWAAFVAATFGDRAQVLSLLSLARRQGEHWGAAGFTRRIAARWPGDVAIGRGLAALRRPAIEPRT